MLEYKQKRNNGRTPFAGVYKFVGVGVFVYELIIYVDSCGVFVYELIIYVDSCGVCVYELIIYVDSCGVFVYELIICRQLRCVCV